MSLVYAIVTNHQKTQLQRIVRSTVADIKRELDDVKENIKLAHGHIDAVRKYMNTLKRSADLQPNLDRIAWAEGDVTAAHRILKNVRKRVASLHANQSEGTVPDAEEGEVASG